MEKKPPDKIRTMMSYEETFQFDEWEASRECADEMMRTIPGLEEDFKLDDVTLGDGQCFSTSCIQQMRRPEVNRCLDPRWQKYAWIMDPRAFKYQVRKFMNTCNHSRIQDMKVEWKNFTGRSWEDYWAAQHIMKKSTWADHSFVQSTAWFLNLDIVIHQNISSNPVMTISGNIENENIPCNGSTLHIGYLLGRHYQSLLPLDTQTKKFIEVETHETGNKCPICRGSYKNVIQHIKKKKSCREEIDDQEYKELDDQSKARRTEKNKIYKVESRKRSAEKSKEINKKSMAKLRKLDPERFKEIDKKIKDKPKKE